MVGRKIGQYLKENGIKQSFVAEKVGITSPKMSDICNKDINIDCILYYKICRVLGLPLETFLDDAEM